MYRDIILRTSTSEKSDTQSVKLIDSRGKKSVNNKISIYSQKYTTASNPPQRQDLKIYRTNDKKIQDSPIAHSTSSNFRQTVKLEPRRQDAQPKHLVVQEPNFPTAMFQSNQIKEQKYRLDANLVASFQEHLQAVRAYYEGKIKEVLEDNAKSISELRNLLITQQHRIAEKEDQIARLINQHQNKMANARYQSVRRESPQKSRSINANASYEYLCNKIRDLDINVKLIIDQFADSESEIADKLKKVENQCIRYFAEKLGSCQFKLAKFIENIERKCASFENYIIQVEKQQMKGCQNVDLDSLYGKLSLQLRQKIGEISQDIRNFSSKQYKYQNERVESLQNVLVELLGKFGALQKRNSLQNSRRMENGYFLEDDDEFFYPSSERKVYETNDDYEHFQSESDEDRSTLTKQNISNNVQFFLAQKLKKV